MFTMYNHFGSCRNIAWPANYSLLRINYYSDCCSNNLQINFKQLPKAVLFIVEQKSSLGRFLQNLPFVTV